MTDSVPPLRHVEGDPAPSAGGVDTPSTRVTKDTHELATLVTDLVLAKLETSACDDDSLIELTVRRAVWAELQKLVVRSQKTFDSLEEEREFLTSAVGLVAEAVRAQANAAINIGTRALVAADRIDGKGQGVDLAKVRTYATSLVTELAMRAYRHGDIEGELAYRQILSDREDLLPRNRILNLYHLQELHRMLGDPDSCIGTNESLIDYIEELLPLSQEDEQELGLDSTLSYIVFRARDTIFAAKFQKGAPENDAAIEYYSQISRGSPDLSAIGTALKRLQKISRQRGEVAHSLDYGLQLVRHEFGRNRNPEAHKALRKVREGMKDWGIGFKTLGADLEQDLERLEALGPIALSELALMAKKVNHFRAQISITEALLKKELDLAEKLHRHNSLTELHSAVRDPEARLTSIDRHLSFIDETGPDALVAIQVDPGSLKFGIQHKRYETQIAFKEKLGDRAEFDPEERQRFYEDHLVKDETPDLDKVECLIVLAKLYEINGDIHRAYSCASILMRMDVNYRSTSIGGELERRLGNMLSISERDTSQDIAIDFIRARHQEAKRLEQERQREAERLEQERQRELDRERARQAKRDLLSFLEELRDAAPSWRDMRGMKMLPRDEAASTFDRFDELVVATKDPSIPDLTRYLRQQLNATATFVRLTTLDSTIRGLREMV